MIARINQPLYYTTLGIICQVFVLFAIIFAVTTPVSATNNTKIVNPALKASDGFYFSKYTTDYYLSRADDGTSKLDVTDRITAEFPSDNSGHGITRTIPFTNQNGANLTINNPSSFQFTATRNGSPEPIDSFKIIDNNLFYRIGNSDITVNGTQEYELEYAFQNVITQLNGFQQLYWDASDTGNDGGVVILTVNLHLADNLKDTINPDTMSCYVGAYGSNSQTKCIITKIDDGFQFVTTDLMPGEGLTFAVDFKDGTFKIPVATGTVQLIIATIICATLALTVAIFTIFQYRKQVTESKRYYKQLLTPVQYIPFKDLTVAESAEIYLGKTKPSQVATLLELAVTHKIAITKPGDDKKWHIELQDVKNLTTAQTDVLKIIGGPDATIENGQTLIVKNRSATSSSVKTAQDYKTSTALRLQDKKLLQTPTPTNRASVISIIGACLAGIATVCILMFSDGTLPFYLCTDIALPCLGLTIICITFAIWASSGTKYLIRTNAGLDASNYFEGLKEYISLAEAERLKFLQSVKGADTSQNGIVKLYERLLPYACIFGLEKSWLAELNKYYQENDELSPTWYVGASYLALHDFDRFTRSASGSYHSSASYSSSSSSGSGGSGFSGGGGGGGSTGHW